MMPLSFLLNETNTETFTKITSTTRIDDENFWINIQVMDTFLGNKKS